MTLSNIFLLLIYISVICIAEAISFTSQQDRAQISADLRLHEQLPRFLPPLLGDSESINGEDLHLLDIVLVASVDGKFHALNRTSGQTLWSMSSFANPSKPSGFAPLVRTVHAETDPDTTDDDTNQEIYVIEPQSGEIFVMPTPNSPLQRFPFTMPQLVEMSPLSFSGDDGDRTFVGSKETSLLLIELETGKVKAIVNSKCPWDPLEDLAGNDNEETEIEDTDKEIQYPSEVFIGRTDYFVTIQTGSLHSSSFKRPFQNLSFSVYGPNNRDSALQVAYRRTPDDAYIQSLTNGKIMSFRAQGVDTADPVNPRNSQPLWGSTFRTPVVAVFDVLKAAGRQQPFVLFQPRARLQDIMPNVDFHRAARSNKLPNLNSAFVGLVEETGSLFAMSPDHFPFVVFGDANAYESQRLIEPPPGEVIPNEDSYQWVKKPLTQCKTYSGNLTCLTGVRGLEASSRSRLSRLLDGAPSVSLPPSQNPDPPIASSKFNVSIVPTWIWRSPIGSPRVGSRLDGVDVSVGVLSTTTSFLFALVLGIFWMIRRVVKTYISHPRVVADKNQPPGIPHEEKPSADLSPPLPNPSLPEDLALDPPPPPVDGPVIDAIADDIADAEESEREAAPSGKRKGLRRKRGKKKRANLNESPPDGGDGEQANTEDLAPNLDTHAVALEQPPVAQAVTSQPSIPALSLIVSDTVLGVGSHGTMVFRGSFQGRAVAVKRLLQDFVTLASREVSVLQESDDHPNVIRYYYQEAQGNFLYIALELCPSSLADIVENPDQFLEISATFDPKRALREVTSGMRHLHSLKIIHRDIKPQNILVSSSKQGTGRYTAHRMLISDFGLCKKLEVDQTSFLPTVHGMMAAGTVGWRAPEILRGEVQLDESPNDEQSRSSHGSVATVSGSGSPPNRGTRLTKFVDIFSLGCLFYYTLTNGGHPFGDRYEREANILKGIKNLDGLTRFGEEGFEGTDLIGSMLDPEASRRPDTTTCLLHPFFWNPGRRLNFLQDASDRFEIMCRDPRDANLTVLEQDAFDVVGKDWHSRLDKVLVENLGKFRKYDGKSVQDLLRALRNKKHHYQDLPENVQRHLGPMPQGFLAYFTRRFPLLFLHVHSVISSTSLRTESMFRSYFELSEG